MPESTNADDAAPASSLPTTGIAAAMMADLTSPPFKAVLMATCPTMVAAVPVSPIAVPKAVPAPGAMMDRATIANFLGSSTMASTVCATG